ncbi:hypothetical protein SLE2022_341900 [Rubroshorea leprosula]
MSVCFPSTPVAFILTKVRNLKIRGTHIPVSPSIRNRNPGSLRLIRCNVKPSARSGSEEYEFHGDVGFKEKSNKRFELGRSGGHGAGLEKVNSDSGSNDPDENWSGKGENGVEEEELVKIKDEDTVDLKRKGKQVMRRSNLVAKQVISIQSAISLGFVSQLWVDTNSWVVLVVEMRPTLLSGESERFLLQDVSKVGDVVLVEDDSVMENAFRMVGLETLVGYRVLTPGRRNIGKVRGYTFNINSGAVESLELDSFGISIIPSSLVSTYALLVEDVLEVVADTVIVHEAAASRIQRLTKGFWDTDKARTSMDESGEYSDLERPVRCNDGQSKRRSYGSKSSRSKRKELEDDWELPMDYL